MATPINFTSFNNFANSILINASEGIGVDADNYYGYQCWDLGQILFRHFGRNFVTQHSFFAEGSSAVYTTVTYAPALNANRQSPMQFISDYHQMKRGDMCIWKAGGCNGLIGSFGHNAYSMEDYRNDMTNFSCMGQNQVGYHPNGHVATVNDYFTFNGWLGAFRYTPWNDGSVTPNPPPLPDPDVPIPPVNPDYVSTSTYKKPEYMNIALLKTYKKLL